MFDVLITNARIVDGTGRPEYRGNIGITSGTIRAIGSLPGARATLQIDAGERTVTPGFVEAHGHSDLAVKVNPTCESNVAQGVTTEVFGNCGESPHPLRPGGDNTALVPSGVDVDWTTTAEYFSSLARRGTGMNAVPLVGHQALRFIAMNGEDREASPNELDHMKRILAESMQAGARGFSTGLVYPPTVSASTLELVELAKVVGEYGGIYSTHIRSYYHERYNESLDEAAHIARESGTRLVLSHLTIHGKGNWGRAPEILGRLDWYRQQGLTVHADTFTYPIIGVWWGPRAVLPLWAFGIDSPLQYKPDWAEVVRDLQEVIADPDRRARLKADIEARIASDKSDFYDQFFSHHGWDCIYIEEVAPSSPCQPFVGQSMEEAAAACGTDPCDLFLDLIESDGEYFATSNIIIRPEDHRAMLCDPYMMIGNDIRAVNPGLGSAPYNRTQVGPRHYGSFIRMIEQHVMRDRIMSLPEAVRKMSALPCEVYGLSDRGTIQAGKAADIVIFDRYRVRERGTYRLPHAYPDGIDTVLINGEVVYRQGQFTGARPGRVLST